MNETTIMCPACLGTGDQHDAPCRWCDGTGEITPRSRLTALMAQADLEQGWCYEHPERLVSA